MRDCELCTSPATMYCESDQAILCWNCDSKVHSANFLVARHSRTLLCRSCQSPTPWTASGSNLSPTISLCDRCSPHLKRREITPAQQTNPDHEQDEIDGGDDSDEDYDDDDEEENEEEEEEEEEEDGENQVVPWSSTPPPIPSSSSSDDSSTRFGSALKRMRENADLSSQDDLGCSSSRQGESSSIDEESMTLGGFSPLNERRKVTVLRSQLSRSDLIHSVNEDEVPAAVDLVSTAFRSR